nr:MotA/TolQ/ExbB proton channel family protein [uncultured Bacteroides sp.]
MNFTLNALNNFLTYFCCGSIFFIFFIYFKYLLKVKTFKDKLNKTNETANIDFLENGQLSSIWKEYKRTFCYDVNGIQKTDVEAEDLFYINSVLNSLNINPRTIMAASGILVGLGLLGTFIGLTVAIKCIDTSSSENLMASINGLLGGMSTAFFTSIIGMTCSSIIIVCEKKWYNKLQKSLNVICSSLDEKYYISRYQMYKIDLKKQNEFLINAFSHKDRNGNDITPGAILRDIYEETSKQSAALGHFTSDLSEAINNAMDATLSNQLETKIVPLINILANKIDQLSANIQAPADDMTKAVVDDLKKSMEDMMEGFKSSISSSATGQMDSLAIKLNQAGDALNSFPESLNAMQKSLMGGFEDIRNMVSDISTQSSNANQEALNCIMNELNGTISNVKNIVTDLSNTAATNSSKAIEQMNEQVDIATRTMANILEEVKNTVNGINEGHHGLLNKQQQNTQETEDLINSFKTGVARMKEVNDQVVNTINQYSLLQSEAQKATEHLSNASGNMSLIMEQFHKSQQSYQEGIAHYQNKNENTIENISLALDQAKSISTEYAQKFGLIQNGLSSIFSEINTGLNQYSSTVRENTQKYLDSYSNSLTTATSALSNAMERQNDIVEELVDGLALIKKNN